jgi:hypothetical protein
MSYGTVGVYYDSETVRYHLGLFRNINPVKDFTSFNDSELFLSTNLTCKIAVLHVPYPFNPAFTELVLKLQKNCNHIFVIASEVHPEIVSFIQQADFENITYYICGLVNFQLDLAQVKQFMDWFETTTYFYRHWLPELLTRLKPFETKPKSFDMLLGRKKLHRDQIYLHCAMGGIDLGELTYFNDTNAVLDDPKKWLWEGVGVSMERTPNWTIDKVKYYGHEMSLSQVIPIDIYNRTAYTAVAETCFHDNFAFFTEKTCKPIIARRLFIFFAGRYYLQNLQKLGFKTFDGIIDESYDQEFDALVRWRMAYEQMVWLWKQPQEQILEKIRPIVEHNFTHMMTTNWADDFRHTLEQDFVRAIAG